MTKQVILITGTPGVGKTAVAHALTEKLEAKYINLTDLAVREKLTQGRDKKRDSIIIDEKRMKERIAQLIKTSDKEYTIIDGHYSPIVVKPRLATRVFVLRRDPVELQVLQKKAGFTGQKLWENLASEILDSCLAEALKTFAKETDKICEIDVTGKSTESVTQEILDVLKGKAKCYFGVVDWIGKLEREGMLDDYLKI